MKELALIFASVISFEDLLVQLDEAVNTYNADPSKENRSKVSMVCLLITTKDLTDKKDPLEIIEQMNKTEKFMKLGEIENS